VDGHDDGCYFLFLVGVELNLLSDVLQVSSMSGVPLSVESHNLNLLPGLSHLTDYNPPSIHTSQGIEISDITEAIR
jgi:hypothetical protein